MQNIFVILSGLPASGKSTLARMIARGLGLPTLDKDDFLERLFEEFGTGDAAWRSRLSRAADDELQRQAAHAAGAVITSWWRHPRSLADSGTSTQWLAALSGELVEIHCICSPTVAAARFVGRIRHAGHLDAQRSRAALRASFEEQAKLGPLGIGRLIEFDTETTMADVAQLLRAVAIGGAASGAPPAARFPMTKHPDPRTWRRSF